MLTIVHELPYVILTTILLNTIIIPHFIDEETKA